MGSILGGIGGKVNANEICKGSDALAPPKGLRLKPQFLVSQDVYSMAGGSRLIPIAGLDQKDHGGDNGVASFGAYNVFTNDRAKLLLGDLL